MKRIVRGVEEEDIPLLKNIMVEVCGILVSQPMKAVDIVKYLKYNTFVNDYHFEALSLLEKAGIIEYGVVDKKKKWRLTNKDASIYLSTLQLATC